MARDRAEGIKCESPNVVWGRGAVQGTLSIKHFLSIYDGLSQVQVVTAVGSPAMNNRPCIYPFQVNSLMRESKFDEHKAEKSQTPSAA